MVEQYKDKFSIGLSLDITLNEYQMMIQMYKEYINSIYFSLPLGDKFHSRRNISESFKDKAKIELFYKVLELFMDNDIKLDCVFNTPKLSEEELYYALLYLKNNIDIDQITCLQKDIKIISEMFPNTEKIFSYNNNLKPQNIDSISSLFDTVVLGRQFLRDYKLVRDVYNNGFDIKILVNNGCSFNCGGCHSNLKCKDVFNNNLKNMSIDELYALQSFYPFELKEFINRVDIPIKYIKISNRTSGYRYIRRCLDSYIYNMDPSVFIMQDSDSYRLWGRQANFNPYLDSLNEDNILEEKLKLLERSRTCT